MKSTDRKKQCSGMCGTDRQEKAGAAAKPIHRFE